MAVGSYFTAMEAILTSVKHGIKAVTVVPQTDRAIPRREGLYSAQRLVLAKLAFLLNLQNFGINWLLRLAWYSLNSALVNVIA
jgi:hypothetical protein